MPVLPRFVPLLLLVLLFIIASPSTTATRVIKFHRKKLRQARKEAQFLQQKIYKKKRKCTRRRLHLYRKAVKTKGCNFYPGNGLKAVKLIRKHCWKRHVHFKYRSTCRRRKSSSCKQALAFVKRAEWLQCEKKIKELEKKLNNVKQKIDSLILLVNIKPSNAPRKMHQDCLAGDSAQQNRDGRCWG